MKSIFPHLLAVFALLAAATALRAQAPDSLADVIYRESSVASATLSAVFTFHLRADGTYSSLVVRAGTATTTQPYPLVPPHGGTYAYLKLSASRARLTFTPTGQQGFVIPGPRELRFESPESGTMGNEPGDSVVRGGTFGVAPRAARAALINVSTRGLATPIKPLIVGFVIDGRPRDVLLRAVGPTLRDFGVSDAATGTQLSLYRGATLVRADAVAAGDNLCRSVSARCRCRRHRNRPYAAPGRLYPANHTDWERSRRGVGRGVCDPLIPLSPDRRGGRIERAQRLTFPELP